MVVDVADVVTALETGYWILLQKIVRMQRTFASGSPKCSQHIMACVAANYSERSRSVPLIARVVV